jgi:hypothetical protein
MQGLFVKTFQTGGSCVAVAPSNDFFSRVNNFEVKLTL